MAKNMNGRAIARIRLFVNKARIPYKIIAREENIRSFFSGYLFSSFIAINGEITPRSPENPQMYPRA